ncbi:hypothetical protein BDZ89DRAFT_1065827 [Hymenopellis radicata]|nr:hypothetical protein BDZ89DRAFT_1065827 [Hymenopellis radicata]
MAPVDARYNGHTHIMCLGPHGLLVRGNSGVYEYWVRAQLQGIADEEVIARDVARGGSWPATYARPHGSRFFRVQYNDDPTILKQLSTIKRDGTVIVPNNGPVTIDDLLPPLPAKVTQARVDQEELERLRKMVTQLLLEKEEREQKFKMRISMGRKLQKERKQEIDDAQLASRMNGGRVPRIHQRSRLPFPESCIQPSNTITAPRTKDATISNSNQVASASGSGSTTGPAVPVVGTISLQGGLDPAAPAFVPLPQVTEDAEMDGEGDDEDKLENYNEEMVERE